MTDRADLQTGEAALLAAMRTWVVGHLRRVDLSDRVAAALRPVGVHLLRPDLDGFMGALCRGARRPIAVLCLCRDEVSADELLLLDAFALLQEDEAQEAEERLAELIVPDAAIRAVDCAGRVARGLLWAGIPLGGVLPGAPATPAPRVLH